jgi:GT2 family glycosyltransferase
METQVSNEAQVTIVVVPRERFSYLRQCIEGIYEHTTLPFKLIVVDGAPPRTLRDLLKERAQDQGFKLIHSKRYLTPNQARNLSLSHIDTPYVVFVDNDVLVAPGWLEPLVECADETGAAIVNPVTCQGQQPLHEMIHFVGGEAHIEEVDHDGVVERHLCDKMPMQGKSLRSVLPELRREETEACEFHCVLVRKDVIDEVGPFDEKMLNTKENIDFSMTVLASGGTVYFEPKSVATYIDNTPMTWRDLPYFMIRWSDSHTLATLDHLRQKWNLSEDEFFQSRYRIMGWRRRRYIIRPFCKKLPLRRGKRRLEDVLVRCDKIFNRILVPRRSRPVKR